ncbi:hypothetical protein P7H90_12500, partial [Lactococcus lactis]|uniref:hypothetical protein n=1 Tax=Lactococcus lactis TaxID=1358 RepID=UPI00289076E4
IIGNPSLNHRYRKGFYSLFKTLQQNPKEEEYKEKMERYNDLKESLEAERSGKVRDVTSDYENVEEMEM